MIICLMGRRGSGKTTIESMLEEQGFNRIVSYTSRRKRQGEIDGKDYIFVDGNKMKRLIDQDKLMEFAEYNGNIYGTPKVNPKELWVCVVEQKGFKAIKEVVGNTDTVLGIALEVKPTTAFNRCMQRPGANYDEVGDWVKHDREVFDGIQRIADITVEADSSVEEVFNKVVSEINKVKRN